MKGVLLDGKVLPHPAYSPVIAPTDFHLFDMRFKIFKELQKCVDDFFASQDETFFAESIPELPKRWLKVIESDGVYFD